MENARRAMRKNELATAIDAANQATVAAITEMTERVEDTQSKIAVIGWFIDRAQQLAREVDAAEGDVPFTTAVDRLVRHLIGDKP